MKKWNVCLIVLISLLLIFAVSYSTFALLLNDRSSIQCGRGIIKTGNTKTEVRAKCGEPTSEESGGRIWVYDRGPHELIKYLTFRGIKLMRIQVGDYGYQ